jgi:hypothetical protein
MSENGHDMVARGLGAGSPRTITIAGKDCHIRPLGIRELTEVERDCVQRYKRQYLETFSNNLDLLPEGRRDQIFEEIMSKVARWDVGNLPAKYGHDMSTVVVTDGMKKWLQANMTASPSDKDERLQRLTVLALDQETLSKEKYLELTGVAPISVKIPYVSWWITGSYEGMITFTWVCLRRDGVTRDQVEEALQNNMGLLSDITNEINFLSTPQGGNG